MFDNTGSGNGNGMFDNDSKNIYSATGSRLQMSVTVDVRDR